MFVFCIRLLKLSILLLSNFKNIFYFVLSAQRVHISSAIRHHLFKDKNFRALERTANRAFLTIAVNCSNARQSLFMADDALVASANHAPHRRAPARFGNAPTVRNPTHRAVTNATFTSGCVHGHRAWFHLLRSTSSTRCSSAPFSKVFPRPIPRLAICAPQFYIIRGISFVCRMSIQNLNTFGE